MKDPAFLFYSNDFYGGTRTMLPEERACYIDLMIYQHQNGYIPDDPRRVLMYCSGIDEATLKAVLQAKFKLCDKGWYNERLTKETEKRKSYAQNQSVNGSIGQFWKKVKSELKSDKRCHEIRKKFAHLTKEELYEFIIQFNNQDFTSFKAMLQAMLEHLENENENEIEDENTNKDELPEGVSGEKTWRDEFSVYRAELVEQYKRLINDPEFLAKQKRLNPGVNIQLTLEKSCVNFWATEEGWRNKLKSKSKSIDWKSTLAKSISQPMNKVYEQRTNPISEQAAAKRDSLEDLRREAVGHLFGSSGQNHP